MIFSWGFFTEPRAETAAARTIVSLSLSAFNSAAVADSALGPNLAIEKAALKRTDGSPSLSSLMSGGSATAAFPESMSPMASAAPRRTCLSLSSRAFSIARRGYYDTASQCTVNTSNIVNPANFGQKKNAYFSDE